MRPELLLMTLAVGLAQGCASRPVPELRSAPVGILRAERGVILPIEVGAGLFAQCSRPSPKTNGRYWSPTPEDISKFETRFTEFYSGRFRSRALDCYSRQYIGFYSPDGGRFIYANFFMTIIGHTQDPDYWKKMPVIVCDGGSAYFGVVFDPRKDLIVEYELNGF